MENVRRTPFVHDASMTFRGNNDGSFQGAHVFSFGENSGPKGFIFRVIRSSRRPGELGIQQTAGKNLAGDAARLYRHADLW
jgi:hypothetical protein